MNGQPAFFFAENQANCAALAKCKIMCSKYNRGQQFLYRNSIFEILSCLPQRSVPEFVIKARIFIGSLRVTIGIATTIIVMIVIVIATIIISIIIVIITS